MRDFAARKKELRDHMAMTRAQTLRLMERVPDEYLKVRVHDFYSPIGWHFGHIGRTEELWVSEEALGYAALDDHLSLLFVNVPENPKDGRVNLPSRGEIVAYLEETRVRALDALDTADLGSPNPLLADGYAWEFARLHEAQHQETIAELLQLITQTRGAGPIPPAPFPVSLTQQVVEVLVPRWEGGACKSAIGSTNERLLSLFVSAPPSQRGTSTSTTCCVSETGKGAGGIGKTAGGTGNMRTLPAATFQMGSDDPHGYDNEHPAHLVTLVPFSIAKSPVTAGDWLNFMADSGYARPELWDADGWTWLESENVTHPEYWHPLPGGTFAYYGMDGLRAIDPAEPVSSLSWYEADAYARWAGMRLPTEAEWEYAATVFAKESDSPNPMLGGVWEWTASPFLPYDGFVAYPYDGYSKDHMDGKHKVCKGGSWATATDIARPAFRNWYVPTYRQGFLGLRCAL